MKTMVQDVSPRVSAQGAAAAPAAASSAPADRRRGSGDIVATVIASVAIALPLMFYLHQHVEILRLGYEIESLKERRVELAEKSRELRVERTQQASLARVEEQAALMGLSAPPASAIYIASSPMASRGESAPDVAAENGPSVVAKLE